MCSSDLLEMIASENFVPQAVLECQGSVLTNKYAEGYPGKRYYGGCEFVDQVETIAIDRLKQLFDAGYANVQPHSGATANAAALHAIATVGDTILGLDLANGGHLTHGMYALYLFGPFVEKALGRGRFIVAYLTMAVGASVFVYWLSEPYVLTIGASGAISGLFGMAWLKRSGLAWSSTRRLGDRTVLTM